MHELFRMAGELLERDEELARIAAAVRRARDGVGTLIVVEDPAGMGKTEVLRAARAAAEADGLRVLRSRGAELERDFPFGVVRQLFEPALAEAGAGERADVLQGPAALARERCRCRAARPAPSGPSRASPCCTGTTGCARTSPPRGRSCSRSTTSTGPTRRRCAISRSRSPGSRSCRSRSSRARGRSTTG